MSGRADLNGAAAEVAAVAQFLYLEARLADEWQLRPWLDLWVPDGPGRYWVPCGHDDIDPTTQVSLIYDDWQRLNERITRLEAPSIHIQDPRSRLRRSISNVEIVDDNGAVIKVASNFVLGEFRRDVQTMYVGRSIHELHRAGDGYKIAAKKVLLINNGGFLGNIAFIL